MHHKKELQELMRTYSSMKALQLLVALADCEGEISLAQLSAATGIPPSSTHRILQEMQHCGFVIKDEVKKCYRAGFEARLLALQLQKTNFLYEAARGEMAYLNDLSLETIHLIGEEDMEAIYLAKLGAKSSVGLHSAVGKRIPLHCTGGGKAILAWKSESWLENYLAHVKRERFTGKTLTDAEDLRRERSTRLRATQWITTSTIRTWCASRRRCLMWITRCWRPSELPRRTIASPWKRRCPTLGKYCGVPPALQRSWAGTIPFGYRKREMREADLHE